LASQPMAFKLFERSLFIISHKKLLFLHISITNIDLSQRFQTKTPSSTVPDFPYSSIQEHIWTLYVFVSVWSWSKKSWLSKSDRHHRFHNWLLPEVYCLGDGGIVPPLFMNVRNCLTLE
jgi:hypothetical protein